jgi:hypothetical protein
VYLERLDVENVEWGPLMEAVKEEELNRKGVAAAVYPIVEQLLQDGASSLQQAYWGVHEWLLVNLKVRRSVATIRDWYKAASYVFDATGEFAWLEDRTYTEHLYAARSKFAWDLFVAGEYRGVGNVQGTKARTWMQQLKIAATDLQHGDEMTGTAVKMTRGEQGHVVRRIKALVESALPMVLEAKSLVETI